MYVQAFTSGVPFGYSNEHHSLFFSLKSGENVTLPFYNRPEDDMQAHKGDLWVFDFSTTDLPCFDYHDVDKVVLVENSNDGWHIESVTTILSIKGLHHKSWALLTVDLDANFWIDGNAGDDRKKHELTRVKLFPSRRPPGPLSTPP